MVFEAGLLVGIGLAVGLGEGLGVGVRDARRASTVAAFSTTITLSGPGVGTMPGVEVGRGTGVLADPEEHAIKAMVINSNVNKKQYPRR